MVNLTAKVAKLRVCYSEYRELRMALPCILALSALQIRLCGMASPERTYAKNMGYFASKWRPLLLWMIFHALLYVAFATIEIPTKTSIGNRTPPPLLRLMRKSSAR